MFNDSRFNLQPFNATHMVYVQSLLSGESIIEASGIICKIAQAILTGYGEIVSDSHVLAMAKAQLTGYGEIVSDSYVLAMAKAQLTGSGDFKIRLKFDTVYIEVTGIFDTRTRMVIIR